MPERNPIQRIADDREIFAAGLGDDKPLPLAIEQLETERFFQRLDLLADGALGDVQLFRRAREAFAARRSLEGLEGIERRQAARHRLIFHEKN